MELADLVDSIDIVEFISKYVDLEQRGDEWWGLSCFKEENTPSFSVRKTPPVFYDYSSGVGGNVFTFAKRYFRCSNEEAVKILADFCGADAVTMAAREKMAATMVCKRFLPPKSHRKASAATILPDNYMERYETRPDKTAIWEQEGISKETMARFQVFYDGFSDRIVYPIRNLDGKIVNIGGRTVDPAWKEKGQRKYCYFHPWGTLDTIYGLYENMDEIVRKHEIILFEGCKSVLIADTWGIKNAAAILTSHVNPNQMRILAKLGCRVVFALDKDVDVLKDHNIARLKNYVNVEMIRDSKGILEAKDSPVDKGYESFMSLYNGRVKVR